ncbi:MAG: magnesium-protoporphyrin IX monomethyl ester (oxidative) cyclase, partial [Pseudomonadota bacterium]
IHSLFLLAVFATMVVRDHARPRFHEALGVDIEQYDRDVLSLTSEISRQVFPIEIDLEHPTIRRGLKRLVAINEKMAAAKRRGGALGALRRAGLAASAAGVFARMYLTPVKKNPLPETVRLQPVW